MDIQTNIPQNTDTSSSPNLKYTGGGKKAMVLGIVFFIFCLLLSGGLYAYNYKLKKDIEDTQKTIRKQDESIQELLADSQVHAYKMFLDNKATFDSLEKFSQISEFIQELTKISKKYALDFENISIDQGVIKISGIATSSENIKSSYQKISKFVSEYNASQKALQLSYNKRKQSGQESSKTLKKPDLTIFYNVKDILQYKGEQEIEFSLEITVQ